MQAFVDGSGNVGVKVGDKTVFKTKDKPLAQGVKVGTAIIEGIFVGENEMVGLRVNGKRYNFKKII